MSEPWINDTGLKLYLELPGFVHVELTYSVRKGFRINTADGEVRLEHDKLPEEAVTRHISGIWEQTNIKYFHSLSGIKIGSRMFVHGGNSFFRQNNTKLSNLLWRNGDFSKTFFRGGGAMINNKINTKNTMSGIFIVNTAYFMKTDVD